jgi:hypothetical protein
MLYSHKHRIILEKANVHTKKLCPVASRNTHQLLSTWMEIQVGRDIVDLAVERRPCVITFIV